MFDEKLPSNVRKLTTYNLLVMITTLTSNDWRGWVKNHPLLIEVQLKGKLAVYL